MLIVANHAGNTFAWDAAMIGTAVFLEADPPRLARGLGEFFLPTIPFFNVFMARVGGVVGTPKNARDILEHGEAVIAFPEGVRGMNKTFAERYQLQEFGYGFLTTLQQKLGVTYGQNELDLINKLYNERKQYAGDAAKQAQLDQAFDDLVTLQVSAAASLL